LLVLADKIPQDLRPVITKSPALPAFLRSISDLSEAELRQLSAYADRVRANRSIEQRAGEDKRKS
jgi:hypothetical protein